MSQKIVLRAWFDRWPHLKALVDGTILSDRVRIERQDLNFTTAIRAMMRDDALDLAETPVTTLLIARSFGKPYLGLPVFVSRDFHHRSIVVRAGSSIRRPEDLKGARIGVRAYSVTTGVWVRALLQNEHGVDPASVTWITTEDSHVQEYRDPPNVERAPSGTTLLDLLLRGDIQAAIGLKNHDFSQVRPLFQDVDRVTAAWFARTGVYPINHLIAVRSFLLEAHPWLAGELFTMFERAKTIAMKEGWGEKPTLADGTHRDLLTAMVGPDVLPNGYERNAAAIEMALAIAFQQGLTPRHLHPNEVFAEVAPARTR